MQLGNGIYYSTCSLKAVELLMNKWNSKFHYQVASCWLFILSCTAMHGSMNIKLVPNRTICLCLQYLHRTVRSHTDYYSTRVKKSGIDFKALLARSELQKLKWTDGLTNLTVQKNTYICLRLQRTESFFNPYS